MATEESAASARLDDAGLQAQHLMNDLTDLYKKIGSQLSDKAHENLRDAYLDSIKVMKFLRDARGWQLSKEERDNS